MDRMKLIDLGFTGPKFTWRGTRNNSLVLEWLIEGWLMVLGKIGSPSLPSRMEWCEPLIILPSSSTLNHVLNVLSLCLGLKFYDVKKRDARRLREVGTRGLRDCG
ncbi:hypothetical protein ACFX2G_029197 [Malus domestica]